MPGSVILSGSRWCSRSMAKSAMSAHANTRRTTISRVQPNTHQCSRNITIVRSSTIGYLMLIRALHFRQRPFKVSQLTTGMLSNQRSS